MDVERKSETARTKDTIRGLKGSSRTRQIAILRELEMACTFLIMVADEKQRVEESLAWRTARISVRERLGELGARRI